MEEHRPVPPNASPAVWILNRVIMRVIIACARQQQQLKETQETFVETDILLRAGQVRTSIEAG